MMTQANDFAFPQNSTGSTTNWQRDFGLTKREWFAGQFAASGKSPQAAVAYAEELIKWLNVTEHAE